MSAEFRGTEKQLLPPDNAELCPETEAESAT